MSSEMKNWVLLHCKGNLPDEICFSDVTPNKQHLIIATNLKYSPRQSM